MQNRVLSRKALAGLFSIVLLTLSACTKKNEPDASITIQFGKALIGDSASTSVSAASANSGWAVSDPRTFSDIKCFAIAVGGPTPELQKRTCRNAAGTVVLNAGTIVGTFALGSSTTLEVSSGPKRVISVIGFAATSTSACKVFTDATGPDRTTLSAPHVIGSITRDIVPGNNDVSISVSLDGAKKFESCDGIAGGANPSPTPVPPSTGTLALLAGGLGGPGNTDGPALTSRFMTPTGIARDSNGNIFVADSGNYVIRKISSAGVTSVLAGMSGVQGSAEGAGTAARFMSPSDVAVNASGTLYVADALDHTIRQISPDGVVTTLAGSAGSNGSADGTGATARFNMPYGIAIGTSGDIYVADRSNHKIRKITPAGAVTTVAGTGTAGNTDGAAASAKFNFPSGVTVDASENIYVADSTNHTIRKISSGGTNVSTIAGSAGSLGTANGTGASARFNNPKRLVYDFASGGLFVSDSTNHTIRKIDVGYAVTTFAGTAGSYGAVDDTAAAARFYAPMGLAIDANANLYLADMMNQSIRKITATATTSTIAGQALRSGATDATGSLARFAALLPAMAMDAAGNVYVVDSLNHAIRKITPSGVVSTFAGTMGSTGTANGTGMSARFNSPQGMVRDSAGNFYVSDRTNYTIRKITSAGVVSVFAGAGFSGNLDGIGILAQFANLGSMAIDASDNIYVADASAIRKITPAGVVTTHAGQQGIDGYVDSIVPTDARFGLNLGLASDSAGVLYVADPIGHAIRKVTQTGAVSTLAGSPLVSGSNDGTLATARFNYPMQVAVDSAGVVYVADNGNGTIRKINSAAALVSTVVGAAGKQGVVLGSLPATIMAPHGLFIANNLLYIASEAAVLTCEKP